MNYEKISILLRDLQKMIKTAIEENLDVFVWED